MSHLRIGVVQFSPKVRVIQDQYNYQLKENIQKLGQVQANLARARELCKKFVTTHVGSLTHTA